MLLLPTEDPERLDPAGAIGRFILGEGAQGGGRRRLGRAVGQGLPREVGVADDPGAEAGDEVRRSELGVVRDGRGDVALRLDAPDATRLLITVGVVAGDLVVADDLIVPIDDVEAAIGAHRHRDRAEERVVAGDEIREFFERVAGAIALHLDRVDLGGDRVRHVHHVGVALGPDAGVAQGEAAQAGAAQLELRRLHREGRLVGLREAIGAAGVPGVLVERHHRIAVIVGLLDEGLALPRQDQTPDIARSGAGGLEETAIRAEARHARAREIDGLTLRRGDLAGIEGALGQPEPTARGARELVREQVRILDAEAGQEHLTLVGLAVAVGVAQEDDVMTVLDDRAVPVR